jgi:RIP homotypic interaction motif
MLAGYAVTMARARIAAIGRAAASATLSMSRRNPGDDVIMIIRRRLRAGAASAGKIVTGPGRSPAISIDLRTLLSRHRAFPDVPNGCVSASFPRFSYYRVTGGTRMDPVTLIVMALGAGAGSALQDGTKEAVKAAYVRLRELVKKRFSGHPAAELVLAEHESAPQTWEAPLTAKLTELGAADDAELVDAAQTLLALLNNTGKYNVTIHDSKGVQVGDRNVQVNRFGT